jgi:NNP family nitrate/nitrite transporter-like MFS transporter
VGGLGALGGFVLPPLLGAIVASHGQAGYAQGFYIFVALALVAILLAFVLIKSKKV